MLPCTQQQKRGDTKRMLALPLRQRLVALFQHLVRDTHQVAQQLVQAICAFIAKAGAALAIGELILYSNGCRRRLRHFFRRSSCHRGSGTEQRRHRD